MTKKQLSKSLAVKNRAGIEQNYIDTINYNRVQAAKQRITEREQRKLKERERLKKKEQERLKKNAEDDPQSKFETLMQKDWSKEFYSVTKNMKQLEKQKKEASEALKNPAAYFRNNRQSPTKTKKSLVVQFALPDISTWIR